MAPWLDKKKNNCNEPFCGNRLTMRGIVEKDGVLTVMDKRMYCKMWKCPVCGPRQAWKLQQTITEQAKEYKLYRLLTLTLDPKKVKGDPHKYLSNTWRKLRVAFRRDLWV